MRAKKKAIVWGLIILYACLILPHASLADAIPVTVKSAKQDGTVRVRLDTLGTGGNFSLTTSGSYSVGGTALASGTKLSVRFSGGTFSLTWNGVTQSMGTGFTLVRTGSGDSGGIKIAEAGVPANLYPGDLEFLVRGGVAYAVCHVFIEDYLNGVVAYEMSNSFPLEALKAQAVTARTYALRRMASASGNYYDLRDTTGDQVYRGTPSGDANAKSAVTATAGQVLMYGSDYCAVYYSSSNGGQTESAEHAWGGTGFAYLTIKDDPYDLAHPSAALRQATIYSNYSSNTAAVQGMLSQRLFSQHGVSTAISTVESVAPESPRYTSPSRLYTQMRITVRCTNGQAYSLTVSIFGTLDGTLGLSMSGLQNELFTVQTISGGFRVQARRYGHGVGLSQYGAAQMANQGLSYLNILGFYFEGATLVQHSFIHEGGTTETPAVTPAPGTSLGQATVVLSDPSNTLNLRSQPSTNGGVLLGIPHGATVTVYSIDDGWARVQYGSQLGYVASRYLQLASTSATATPGAGTALVSLSSGSLNMRARESVTADVLISIPNGARVSVLSQGSVWTQVGYGGQVGFVMTSYLRLDGAGATVTPTPTPTPSASQMTARVTLTDTGSKLNLRSQPNTTSDVLTRLTHGQEVTVLERGSVWSQVHHQGINGYVMTQYLSFSTTEATPTPTPIPTSSDTQTQEIATVSLLNPGSTLNLRQSASTKADVLARIPHGAQVTVLSQGATWCAVSYQGHYGYVVREYLVFGSEDATPASGTGDSSQQSIAYIRTLSGTGTVNLRAAMNLDADVLARIPHGAQVGISGRYDDWYQVTYAGQVGYVSVAYVSASAPSATAQPTPAADSGMTGLVINTARVKLASERSTLNLRSFASVDAPVVCQVDHGEHVDVLSYTADGQWAMVRYGDSVGYAAREFLTLTYDTATVRLGDPASSLALRQSPSSNADSLAKLSHGLILTVLERGAQWTRVCVPGGKEGYVATEYLTFP